MKKIKIKIIVYKKIRWIYKKFIFFLVKNKIVKNKEKNEEKILKKVKKILKNDNAPENIQKLYKEIAEILFYSAIGRYGKGKEIKYSYRIYCSDI